jgi:hypothetical protein
VLLKPDFFFAVRTKNYQRLLKPGVECSETYGNRSQGKGQVRKPVLFLLCPMNQNTQYQGMQLPHAVFLTRRTGAVRHKKP